MSSLPSRFLAALLMAGLAGCVHQAACPPNGNAALLPDWRDTISDADHGRLRGWRTAFVDALRKARGAGFGADIDREGDLLNPDYALDGAVLPVGYYRCRTIKLGAKEAGHRDFIAYPAHRCQVRPSGSLNRLVQLDGAQRPSGRLYADGSARTIFLGTMMLGDETKPITYGRDQDRDVVGAVQRIGPARWRMMMPSPSWESTMDVMELVPEG